MRTVTPQRASRRGQALVLASLSLLLLALMVALSFNISHALRGKTRLQQHSDAMAYSMAVVQARALNYFAISNRSTASALVAMNTLHAYMAAASVTSSMLGAGKTNMQVIAAQEFLQCIGCPKAFSRCKHCIHGAEAIKISNKFGKKEREYGNKVKNLESTFNTAVQMLNMMMKTNYMSQQAVFASTVSALQTGSSANLSKLKEINAPKSNGMPGAVGALNVAEFTCAIDGMPCVGGGRPASTNRGTRAKVMTEIANAARPSFTANRGGAMPDYLHPLFLKELMRDIQGRGFSMPVGHKGSAKTVQNTSISAIKGGSGGNNEGKYSGAYEDGTLTTQWRDGFWFTGYDAEIYSGASGSKHKPNNAHSGTHTKFDGVNAKDVTACLASGNCFMHFRSDSSGKNDFGQPHVYSYVSEKLRMGNPKQAPWEINSQAKVNLKFGPQSASIDLAADEGAAVSNALVYYHRLGDWKEPPNMFNPFWRAKLHPFTGAQAAKVLGAAGNTDAAQLAVTPNLPL